RFQFWVVYITNIGLRRLRHDSPIFTDKLGSINCGRQVKTAPRRRTLKVITHSRSCRPETITSNSELPDSLVQFVVLWAWLTQSSTTVTLRTGDVARQLTEQDIAALELVLPAGGKPWLLNADNAQDANSQYVQAFLPATVSTPALRRGTVITVERRNPLDAWVAQRAESYAQVAIPGRNFDQIQGDQDLNRPFRVFGRFDDTELVQLVGFLRSNPPTPGVGPDAIQSWPILSIIRKGN